MFKRFKNFFYFPFARYFKFFATVRLTRWQPRIIVVTGSSGKTTLLHLIEAQLGARAKYSHHANSAYGLAFNILGLSREKLTPGEWLRLIVQTPFRAFQKPPTEKIYVVEADCDRPGEGRFLAPWLNPEVTIWLNTERSHSQNFTSLVPQKFPEVEAAIAYEFGYFPAHTSSLVIANGDSPIITRELTRTRAKIEKISSTGLTNYRLGRNQTEFATAGKIFTVPALLPREAYRSIQAVAALARYLQLDFDLNFIKFVPPPGRLSVFRGLKQTTLLDSSYNATLAGDKAILDLFKVYPAGEKWLVLGDILEQGELEQEEHERLAELAATLAPERVILVGPRVNTHTYPKLKLLAPGLTIEKFLKPKDALTYLEQQIGGSETILFKGARFLEGIIEHLLLDKKDLQKLCRREKIWQTRRWQWDL